jgi:hypothetical protein
MQTVCKESNARSPASIRASPPLTVSDSVPVKRTSRDMFPFRLPVTIGPLVTKPSDIRARIDDSIESTP